MEATGPGAGARGDFSADGVPLVRWASANFDFFRGFFLFLGRFLPVFVPFFALFPSMPCAYLYVNNFFPVSLACRLLKFVLTAKYAKGAEGGLGNPASSRRAGTTPWQATNGARPNNRKDAEDGLGRWVNRKVRQGRKGGWGGWPIADFGLRIERRTATKGAGTIAARPARGG